MRRRIQTDRMSFGHVLIIAVATALMGTQANATESWDVQRVQHAPVIDGVADEAAWASGTWRTLDHLWWGSAPEATDFSARYKLVWTPEHLYLLAEITDDILIDSHPDPLHRYWEDDALEYFLDEDASGGEHRYSHNAFAQHVALDNQSVDFAPADPDVPGSEPGPALFPDHVRAAWRRNADAPHTITWEVEITVFGADYHQNPNRPATSPVTLETGKVMGFMLGYCDADSPSGREHFMGDVAIEPVDGDRNRGYIDADVFGRITLTDSP